MTTGHPPLAPPPPEPSRRFLPLLAVALAVPAAILVAAAWAGSVVDQRADAVRNCLDLRRQIADGLLATPPTLADARRVRTAVRQTLPDDVAATDDAWHALTDAVDRGTVPPAVAVAASVAFDGLIDRAADRERVARTWAGLLPLAAFAALVLPLAASLIVLRHARGSAFIARVCETRFAAFMNNSPAVAFIKDADGRYLYVNDLCARRFSLPAADWLGKRDADLWPAEVADAIHANDKATLAGGRTITIEEVVPTPDGAVRDWLVYKFPLELTDSRTALGGVALDLTDQKRAGASVRASEERLRLAVSNLPVALYVVDRHGVIVVEEGRGLAALGRRPGQAVGRKATALAENAPAALDELGRALAGEAFTSQLLLGERSFDVIHAPQMEGDRVVGAVVVACDITAQAKHLKQIEEQRRQLEAAKVQLEIVALKDSLTGLNNRRAFDDQLAVEVRRATRHHTALSLVLLDLDHFKRLNDDFGHPAGDAVLRVVGRILRASAREIDFVARYGGEEFAAILPSTDAGGSFAVAERLRKAIEDATWPHRPVTASLGVATWAAGDGHTRALVSAADRALYAAKKAGRNCVQHATLTTASAAEPTTDPAAETLPGSAF